MLVKGSVKEGELTPSKVLRHRQGTNAHIVLDVLENAPRPSDAARAVWQRRRCWVAPPAHALLQAFAAGGHDSACFELALSQPRLAALRDHQVCAWIACIAVAYDCLLSLCAAAEYQSREREDLCSVLCAICLAQPII